MYSKLVVRFGDSLAIRDTPRCKIVQINASNTSHNKHKHDVLSTGDHPTDLFTDLYNSTADLVNGQQQIITLRHVGADVALTDLNRNIENFLKMEIRASVEQWIKSKDLSNGQLYRSTCEDAKCYYYYYYYYYNQSS